MKKILKFIFFGVLALVLILGSLLGGFIYKVKNGFPVFYETKVPQINFSPNKKAFLFFSKTTGFSHSESIEASKKVFESLGKSNGWFVYQTEEGGVFNPDQLAKFSAVIFNNSTGEVINDAQKRALETYVGNGGKLIGIHGVGDDSHHWDWYTDNLLGATFSHHPLNPQIQETSVLKDPLADSLLSIGIPTEWKYADEWYVFKENPRSHGFEVLYTIDGEQIIPNGNMLWISDKNFGMGQDHPVAWTKNFGKGKTMYTSMGHEAKAWENTNFVKLIENALKY